MLYRVNMHWAGDVEAVSAEDAMRHVTYSAPAVGPGSGGLVTVRSVEFVQVQARPSRPGKSSSAQETTLAEI
jgi:hypothetical protein